MSVNTSGWESSTHNKLGIVLEPLVTHIPKEWFKQLCGSRVMSNWREERITKCKSDLCDSINVKQMFREEFEDWIDFVMMDYGLERIKMEVSQEMGTGETQSRNGFT